jgi:hypothetical protein
VTHALRRRVVVVMLAALASSSIAPGALAQDPRALRAQEVAREWLALADRQDADATHRAAGAKFREALTAERWREALKRVRGPLGEMVQRTVLSTKLTRTLPGQPDGDYALVAFRTSWTGKTVGRELVSLEYEGARWRVIGYVIQ